MRILSLACLLTVLLFKNIAFAENLDVVVDANLIHLLSDFEILAEIKKPPLLIRIIRLSDHGECNGEPQTCPKQVLYIAVSTFDEQPNQKLYVLPKAYGWLFDDWKVVPKEEGPDHFVIIGIKKKEISKALDKGWWIEKKYEISVNPWKGYIQELK